ncbi:MAG TPA: SRPBCC domain-containing protein [Gammaproteobacteria bacterium]|jgi:uncharacterized protein YndB with AHSA1/START domain
MTDTIEARVEHRFASSAERVFDAWLDSRSVREWMAAALKSFGLSGDIRRVEIDARVGGRFTFSDMREGGEALHWGTYLELDRPRKLVFTWFTSEEDEEASSSLVTLTLAPDGEGCVATLVHRMDAAWTEWVPRVEAGWGRMLSAIEALNA